MSDTPTDPQKVLFVRMSDERGAELHDKINTVRQGELKSVKQFILVCIAEHLAYDHNELAQEIMGYLQAPRRGRPPKDESTKTSESLTN